MAAEDDKGPVRSWLKALVFAALLMVGPTCATAWCCEAASGTERYCVGLAKRDITPRSLDGIYLGGYGLGPERPARGVAGRLFARAIAVSQGTITVVFCAIDTQGHFLAYQDGSFGAADIRRRVAAERAIPTRNVIVASTHDHSAPDDTGIWGAVPDEYLRFVSDQTAAAIEAAIDSERPAHLQASATDVQRSGLLTNVLPGAYPMDTGLQTLVARDDTGAIIGILVNFSAHSDVLGRHNRLISPDWPGTAIARLEKFAPGSEALVILSSAGRSEPEPSDTNGEDLAAAENYGRKVADLVIGSLSQARPVSGPLAAHEVFIKTKVTNGFLRRLNLGGQPAFFESILENMLPLKEQVLFGLDVYGKRGVDLILRSTSPPYLTDGAVVGTPVGAVRIGDVLFAAVPVESFPETRLALANRVRAQAHFLFSLADDQLGYDPPEDEAPAVRRYSADDEALFMTSTKLGDMITQTLMTEAGELGFTVAGKSANPQGTSSASGIRSPDTASDAGPQGCRNGNPLANAENAKWLKVVKPCIAVHGVVTERFPPRWWDDGDYQFNLRLDPDEGGLVNQRNVTGQNGDLVAEIVPADQAGCVPGQPPNPVTAGFIIWLKGYDYGLCTGADLIPPAVGERVTLVGPYVVDEYHGWMEVHPVWAIRRDRQGSR